jgi:flavin reductase (DIM6/NTAB) family NADH-FMN oxidoreductase RutF
MIIATTVYPVPVRDALRNWPTGIAVITTADRDGWWWGCTATSMASVSDRPPLVSVSLPRDSSCRAVFTAADAFAVHVLKAGQEELADRFAAGATDFADLPVECGFESVPLLSDVSIRLECRPVNTVEAGDNVLLLGEVVRARTGPGEPLVHLGEGYRRLARPA